MDNIPVANVDTSGTTSTIAYVTADQLGTPRAIANSSGTTAWQNPYQGNPWGEQVPTSSAYVYNLRFPGQYFDAETGLSNNVNRDYDSSTGRYVESDPIGLHGGVSTYSYVTGNPLLYRDPSGLYVTSVDAFCAQAMEFCLELWGDISHNEGIIQHKLGNDCAAEAAEAAGDLFDTAAKAAKYVSVAKALTKVGIAAGSASTWSGAWGAAKDEGIDQAEDWAGDELQDDIKDNALGLLGKSLVPGVAFGEALQDQINEDLEPLTSAATAVRSALGRGQSKQKN